MARFDVAILVLASGCIDVGLGGLGGGPLVDVCVENERNRCCRERADICVLYEDCEPGGPYLRLPERCQECVAWEVEYLTEPAPEWSRKEKQSGMMRDDAGVARSAFMTVCGDATYTPP